MKSRFGVVLITALLSSVGGFVLAQVPVTTAPDAEALFHSKNPKLERNKQATYFMLKDLIEANHWELADKWIAEDYVQHNPRVPNGRAGVVKFFTETLQRKPTPIADKLKMKVVSVVAEGDYVVLALPLEMKDSKDPTKTYTTTQFNMFRFANGKVVEHWEQDIRNPGDTPVDAH